MKFEHLIQRLHASKVYEEFGKKYKNAFVVAGFFVLDMESKQNLEQIDYYVPSENKVAAFTLGSPVKMQLLEMVKSDTKPQPLEASTNTDIDALSGILDDEMKNRGISEKIKKIVAILHVADGKPTWNLSCILSGMGILKAHVEDASQTVLKMEKSNLFDIMKKLPPAQLKQMQAVQQGVQQAQPRGQPVQMMQPQLQTQEQAEAEPQEGKKISKKDMKSAVAAEIKKLDTVEAAIEKEKSALKSELAKAEAQEAFVKEKRAVKKAKKK